MRKSEALRSLCNAIANTFYPDSATINLVLFNEGINPDAEAAPKDPAIFRAAVSLVMGYVEGSRNENGVQTSVNKDAVEKSIRYWCGIYGLDADDVLSEYLRVMDDGSNRW